MSFCNVLCESKGKLLVGCCIWCSANQRRSQARRVRDRPLSGTNTRTGEDGRDSETREHEVEHDAEALATAPEERLPLGDGGALRREGSSTIADALLLEAQQRVGNGASSEVPVEVICELVFLSSI